MIAYLKSLKEIEKMKSLAINHLGDGHYNIGYGSTVYYYNRDRIKLFGKVVNIKDVGDERHFAVNGDYQFNVPKEIVTILDETSFDKI